MCVGVVFNFFGIVTEDIVTNLTRALQQPELYNHTFVVAHYPTFAVCAVLLILCFQLVLCTFSDV